jgi:tetratricopeptide (TPR) repeat protein
MTPSPAEYFLVAGSQQPQYFSPKYIEMELSKDGVRDSLSEININNSMDVLSCYIGDQDDLKRFIKSFSINSDFQPFIEFTTDNAAAGRWAFREFITCVRSDSIYEHIDWEGFSREQKDQWLSDYEKLHHASEYLIMANCAESYHDRLKYCMDGLAVLPDNPALLSMRKRTEKELFVLCERMVQAGRTHGALLKAEEILEVYPQSAVARMIQSIALLAMSDVQKALDSSAAAIRLEPDNPDVHFCNGLVMHRTGRLGSAVTEYKNALKLADKKGKFAVYSQVRMLDALSKVSSEEDIKLELVGGAGAAAENTPDDYVPTEATRSLAEVGGK